MIKFLKFKANRCNLIEFFTLYIQVALLDSQKAIDEEKSNLDIPLDVCCKVRGVPSSCMGFCKMKKDMEIGDRTIKVGTACNIHFGAINLCRNEIASRGRSINSGIELK